MDIYNSGLKFSIIFLDKWIAFNIEISWTVNNLYSQIKLSNGDPFDNKRNGKIWTKPREYFIRPQFQRSLFIW